MPAFMTNKWFLLALGIALGVALDYKFGLAAKTGLANVLGAPSA
jgi:hypothetical protein